MNLADLRKMITVYFKNHPKIHQEILKICLKTGKTRSEVVLSLTARGLKEYLKNRST
jgi:hypothetical protein